jgi:uncharacterized protein (TIGR03067 family)
MKRTALGFGFVLAAAMAMAWAPAARAQDEEDNHLGTYEYVSGKSGDQDIPKERLTGTVQVTEDMILLLDEEGKESFAISFTAEGEEAPYKLTMKIERSVMPDAVGATAKGLAKHEGDTATLIYDFSEGADFPDDFEPEAEQHLFVLKKVAEPE